MRYLILILSLLVVTARAADDYFGEWHNKKDSFNTLGFALRKDGRGILCTNIGPVLLRWERTDKGILLKIAGDNRPSEMRLTYDTTTKTFVYDKPGGERETFWQISQDEPPDAEAQMEERRRKEQKALPALSEHKETFPTSDALLHGVQSWAEQTPKKSNDLTAAIRSTDAPWNFNLRNSGGSYFIEMMVIQKSADRLTSGLVYRFARSTVEPDLPTLYSLPKPQVEAFRKWLTSHKISFTDEAYERGDPWQIEGYFATIRLKTDRDSLLLITRYLITELFRDTKPPYLFCTYERNGGKQ